MTDDPSILYTTAAALMLGAFAFLRNIATERERRLDAIKAAAQAEPAQHDQQAERQ